MAYNNLMNPYSYGYQSQGYGIPQPNYIQQYRPMTMPRPIQSPYQNILFLNADEMKGRIVDPGTSDLLIDKERSIACVKSADSLGQSSEEYYKLQKIKVDDIQKAEFKQPDINTDDFIKKDYFENFTKKLYEKIGEIETKLTIKEIKGEQ